MAARWTQVKEIFQAAIEQSPAARDQFVSEACGDNVELRREVESLLGSHDATDPFLDTLPTDLASDGRGGEELASVGEQLGPYHLLKRLGAGGMGVVYLAARFDDYQQQVAIKLVKRGMDTDFVLRRFRTERQILAELDHPHIARLLDGGSTPAGLPYFVMEYIDGVPIDRYCDAHSLPIQKRLELFRTVCLAVQHAHRNLVVHRDIKPSNILVSEAGVPKLLDFGVAKLMAPEGFPEGAAATRTGLRMMTPEYASPEQLAGKPVSTASDVYALGVLLFELLCGRRPKRATEGETVAERPSTSSSRTSEARAKNLEEVALRRGATPARLRRLLRGDLDNVVLRAMRTEPERRYESAQALADDIGRHIAGHPVRARPDTFAYRASRFVRRHRIAVTAAVVGAIALIGGLISATYAARIAGLQSARAERRFNDVRKLATALLYDLHDAIAPLAGSTRARHLLVQKARTYLDSLAKEATGDPSLLLEVANAYLRVGDVQGNPANANLGETKAALASYRRSRALLESLRRSGTGGLAVLRTLARADDGVGDMLWETGDLRGAEKAYRRAIAVLEGLLARYPRDAQARYHLARLRIDLGDCHRLEKKGKLAVAQYRAAKEILEELVKKSPRDRARRRVLSVALIKIGDISIANWNLTGAETSYRRARLLRERLLTEQPKSSAAHRDLALVLGRLGNVLLKRGAFSRALATFTRLKELDEGAARADPADLRARRDLGVIRYKLGLVHESRASAKGVSRKRRRADWRAAQTWYQRSLEVFDELRQGGHLNRRDQEVPVLIKRGLERARKAVELAR